MRLSPTGPAPCMQASSRSPRRLKGRGRRPRRLRFAAWLNWAAAAGATAAAGAALPGHRLAQGMPGRRLAQTPPKDQLSLHYPLLACRADGRALKQLSRPPSPPRPSPPQPKPSPPPPKPSPPPPKPSPPPPKPSPPPPSRLSRLPSHLRRRPHPGRQSRRRRRGPCCPAARPPTPPHLPPGEVGTRSRKRKHAHDSCQADTPQVTARTARTVCACSAGCPACAPSALRAQPCQICTHAVVRLLFPSCSPRPPPSSRPPPPNPRPPPRCVRAVPRGRTGFALLLGCCRRRRWPPRGWCSLPEAGVGLK